MELQASFRWRDFGGDQAVTSSSSLDFAILELFHADQIRIVNRSDAAVGGDASAMAVRDLDVVELHGAAKSNGQELSRFLIVETFHYLWVMRWIEAGG
jgi:hypothetical protein